MAKGVVKVDFRDSGDSGGRTRVPEDDYLLKCEKIELTESKSSGNPMLVWTWVISEGKFKGKKLVDRTVLDKKSIWKLRQILEAGGHEVPEKVVSLRYDKYVGMEVGATVVDGEPYNNRIKSEIADYVSTDVLEGSDEDEEELDDEEEDDEDEEEEEDEDEEDEEEEEEPPARKSKAKKAAKKGKKRSRSSDDDGEEIEELDLDEL